MMLSRGAIAYYGGATDERGASIGSASWSRIDYWGDGVSDLDAGAGRGFAIHEQSAVYADICCIPVRQGWCNVAFVVDNSKRGGQQQAPSHLDAYSSQVGSITRNGCRLICAA